MVRTFEYFVLSRAADNAPREEFALTSLSALTKLTSKFEIIIESRYMKHIQILMT